MSPHLAAQLGLGGRGQKKANKLLAGDGGVVFGRLGVLIGRRRSGHFTSCRRFFLLHLRMILLFQFCLIVHYLINTRYGFSFLYFGSRALTIKCYFSTLLVAVKGGHVTGAAPSPLLTLMVASSCSASCSMPKKRASSKTPARKGVTWKLQPDKRVDGRRRREVVNLGR